MKSPTNPWQTHTNRIVYDNPWLRIEHHEVTNPAGGAGIYGLVKFKNYAIGVVPVDEQGYTYLVGQWRYALDRYSWEIPEGGCPLSTDPLETAHRELAEETGLRADRMTELLRFHTSNSVTDEFGIAYVATGLRQGASDPEPTEDITRLRLPLTEALEWVDSGKITDALSIMALQRVELLQLRGEW